MANPNDTEWIPVELELVDRIWLPDTEIDLEEIMVSLEGEKTRKRSKGGYRMGVRPALTKEGPGKAATHKSQKKKKKAIK